MTARPETPEGTAGGSPRGRRRVVAPAVEINQVVTAATGFGHVARCGCGWRAVHDSKIGALVAGQRHVRAAHTPSTTERPTASEGSAA